jgi:putative DNA primase/helicase
VTLLDAALDLHQAALAVVPVATDGTIERFVAKIEESESGCWLWTAQISADGYGQFHLNGRKTRAHRAAWMLLVGDIPPELVLDHPASAGRTTRPSGPARTSCAPGSPTATYDGLGVLTGLTSGNLEMLEVEGRASDLVAQLAPCSPTTASATCGPGCAPATSSRARPAACTGSTASTGPTASAGPTPSSPAAPQVPDTVDVLIETRGEGGFTVTAPSAGRSHPTGLPWRLLAGGPATIPVITVDERDASTRSPMLDQMPAVDPGPQRSGRRARRDHGDRPGDDYNERATWDDILTPTAGPAAAGSAAPRLDPARQGGPRRDLGHHRPRWPPTASTGSTCSPRAPSSRPRRPTPSSPPTPCSSTTATTPRPPGAWSPTATAPAREPAPVLTIAPAGEGGAPRRRRPRRHPRATWPPSPSCGRRPPSTVGDRGRTRPPAHHHLRRPDPLLRPRGRWLVWNGGRWVWQPPAAAGSASTPRTSPGPHRPRHGPRPAPQGPELGRDLRLPQAGRDRRPGHRRRRRPRRRPVDPQHPRRRRRPPHRPAAPPDPTPVHQDHQLSRPSPPPAVDPDPIWSRFLDDTFGTDPTAWPCATTSSAWSGSPSSARSASSCSPSSTASAPTASPPRRDPHARPRVGETGYAIAAPAEMLMIRKHSEHPAELAQLAGARMVVCSELDEGQRFAEAKIKQLTGRDSINARFLYGQPFTFTPTHTMWLLGNHRPQAAPAAWRSGAASSCSSSATSSPSRTATPPSATGSTPPPAPSSPGPSPAPSTTRTTASASPLTVGPPPRRTPPTRTPSAGSSTTPATAPTPTWCGSPCPRCAPYEAWCREVGEEPATPRRLGQELRDRFGVGEAKSNGKRFYTRIMVLEEPVDEPLSIDPDPASSPVTPLPGLS